SPKLAAAEIEGRVRGFDPWPGVWLSHPKGRLRLVEAAVVPGQPSTATPGTVIEGTDGGLALICGGGTSLALERIQLEGRRAMSSREARNGRQLSPGDRLEPL
ncbi:MAG: methionyl-tRNA formyltransferase, partial [Actinobacteria bacterium]|nr:methionyl-tRNA formyltransferase [Actinomycetota bacterium]